MSVLDPQCTGMSTKAYWAGGRRPTGACKRPVGFAVRADGGQRGAHSTCCQAHLGGVVAGMVAAFGVVVVEKVPAP